MNETPCVAVWRHRWLPMSETFIRDQIGALRSWRALTIGRYQMDRSLLRADVAPFTTSPLSRATLRLLPVHLSHQPHLQAMRGADVRLIHAHFATEGHAVVPLARALNLPLVVTCHGFDVTASLEGRGGARRAKSLKSAFSCASRVIAVSEFIADRLVRLGVPPEKVVVHRIGIRTELPQTELAGDGQRSGVLFAGRFVEKKGIDDLLHAFAALPSSIRDVTPLLLAGDGDERPRIERLAQDLGLRPVFFGWQEPAAIRRLMQRSAVFCGPSRTAPDGDSEGFGMVYLEAALCGAPTVAYRHGGVPEAVLDGHTGLLFEEGDVSGLTEGLLSMLSDATFAEEFGRRGRARVLQEFDIARTTVGLEAIYDDVVAD